jgi:hypothetical protein
MDGYGTVLVLGGGVLQEFQTTSVSSLKEDTSRQTGPGTYAAPDGSVLTVRTVYDRDHALLAADSSVEHRKLRRLSALPADCIAGRVGQDHTARRSARARPSPRPSWTGPGGPSGSDSPPGASSRT